MILYTSCDRPVESRSAAERDLVGRRKDDSVPAIGLFDRSVWSWTNVPDQAVVVVSTEPDGQVSWLRPANGYVGFVGPEGGGCSECRFDAYDIDGDLIASADAAE